MLQASHDTLSCPFVGKAPLINVNFLSSRLLWSLEIIDKALESKGGGDPRCPAVLTTHSFIGISWQPLIRSGHIETRRKLNSTWRTSNACSIPRETLHCNTPSSKEQVSPLHQQ